MPVTNPFDGNALVKPVSVQEFDADNLLMQQKRQALQSGAISLQTSQNALQNAQAVTAQKNALRTAVQSGQLDLMNPAHQAQALSMAPDVAPALLDTIQKGQTAKASANKDNATASETSAKALSTSMQGVISNPGALPQFLAQYEANTGKPQPETRALFASAGGDPAKITQIAQGLGLTAEQQLPKTGHVTLGGTEGFTSTNPMTGAVTMTGQVPITQSADNLASTKTQLATTAMNNATSRANNAANISKDYKVAGIDPQTGNFVGVGDNSGNAMSGLIDAIGKNQVPLSTALARIPPAMKAGVMQQLLTKYPDFDETAIGTRQKANKDFTTGPQGNAMRSFAVAGQHLDQLSALADSLNNGNLQIFNKVANAYATQTGDPTPTNFDAVKAAVSKEVTKAMVGAGSGGVSERQELSDAMSNAKSPKQLQGVITNYRNLMAAQHDALLEQRRAAGLPDATLPKYGPAAPALVHPPEITDLLNKYGPK